MHNTAKKYLVDALMFINICSVSIIGILLAFVIPRGPGVPPGDRLFLGLSRYQWANIHGVLSLLLLVLVFIHISLSWKWVIEVSKRLFDHKWKKMLTLISLGWLAVLLVAWLFNV